MHLDLSHSRVLALRVPNQTKVKEKVAETLDPRQELRSSTELGFYYYEHVLNTISN